MIITISGKPGSGKSSVARAVAKHLKYKFFSTGDFRGKIATKKGLTIDQLNDIGKKEFWTDKIVDDEVKRINKKEDNIVLDTWLGFYFIQKALKIYLDVDENEAAKRVFMHQRPDEEKKKTVKEVKDMLNKRLAETRERLKKHYNVDILKRTNYNFIIDTTNLTEKRVVEKILNFINNH